MIGTFSALEDLLRWLVWREEPRGKKDIPTKAPYSGRTGGYADTTDPKTWSTRWEAENYLRELLEDGQKGGLGVVLGDLGNGKYIAGIDVAQPLSRRPFIYAMMRRTRAGRRAAQEIRWPR